MASDQDSPKLKVAVIGAGIAGLGAAIEFQRLPFADLQLYEQARELCEALTWIDTPQRHRHARALRSVLQQYLLKAVDQLKMRLSSRLTKMVELANGKLSFCFEDGYTDNVDLAVGADGVRSVVLHFAFPDHKISYTGTAAYRGLINTQEILNIQTF
ncbi:uncharacterized protein ATNIH1004_010946 [Aspergillus tanneri]|uniref:FAD-binding domain-containing protein n=1 Tax=Aspergillus tanneri TaxID=1220188 RepID=A0A5M9MGB6_9EURO|nr:uncharacterized protein ATNIH1004_010946 [Aspergillus tanneri]KAA8642007.1 hypothetical protein ATNIH1004_010946 [Aspergillus tanneri]